MEKSEWGECWAHFVGALGLPDDATRRRQGEAWYHEFARSREGESVRRAMRRIINAVPAGQAFPDLGLAREHFEIEDNAFATVVGRKLKDCPRCQNSGRITLVAYRSHNHVLWMNFEDYFDAFEKLPTRTAKALVVCECEHAAKLTNFPTSPPDAATALAKYEKAYGVADAANVMQALEVVAK